MRPTIRCKGTIRFIRQDTWSDFVEMLSDVSDTRFHTYMFFSCMPKSTVCLGERIAKLQDRRRSGPHHT